MGIISRIHHQPIPDKPDREYRQNRKFAHRFLTELLDTPKQMPSALSRDRYPQKIIQSGSNIYSRKYRLWKRYVAGTNL